MAEAIRIDDFALYPSFGSHAAHPHYAGAGPAVILGFPTMRSCYPAENYNTVRF